MTIRTFFHAMGNEKFEERRCVKETLERAVQETGVAAVEKARSYVTSLWPCQVDRGRVQ
jgi:hypothetical protein